MSREKSGGLQAGFFQAVRDILPVVRNHYSAVIINFSVVAGLRTCHQLGGQVLRLDRTRNMLLRPSF
jgi:hypothetical protein